MNEYLTSDCLLLLQRAMSYMTAIEIANNLGIEGGWEARRRKVRAIVKELRDDGHWIIADITFGYWLTQDFKLWQQYNEGQRIKAIMVLAEASRRKHQLQEQSQGVLF